MSHQAALAQMSQGNGGGKYSGVEGMQDPAKDVMQRFVGASRSTLDASALLLKALDQAQAEADAGAQANQLNAGMTRQESEQAMAGQLRVLAAVQKALASGKAQPAQLNDGLQQLAKALEQYQAILGDLAELKAGMRKMQAPSNSPALFVAKSLPGNVTDLKRELRGIGEAARTSGATVPDVLLAN
jgi:uncharacterized phage infection (PIP) family protein YhgE